MLDREAVGDAFHFLSHTFKQQTWLNTIYLYSNDNYTTTTPSKNYNIRLLVGAFILVVLFGCNNVTTKPQTMEVLMLNIQENKNKKRTGIKQTN